MKGDENRLFEKTCTYVKDTLNDEYSIHVAY